MSSSSSAKSDFEIEYLEKYFGDTKDVKKQIEDCPRCGFKLFFLHSSDFSHLVMKETASCSHCDYGQRKILHHIN